MRRRVLLTCLSLTSLVACASVLGDFDVATTNDTTVDGSTGIDGSSSGMDGSVTGNDGSTTAEGGGTVEGGPPPNDDAGTTDPTIAAMAVSANATCASVRYSLTKAVTYCWGLPGPSVGAASTDPTVGTNFYRPRTTDVTSYVNFASIVGGGTGDWFMGQTLQGQDYVWGDNTNGEGAYTAAVVGSGSSATATRPVPLKINNVIQTSASLFPATTTGCLLSGLTPYCWGHNDQCQVSFGDSMGGTQCDGTPSAVRTLTSEALNLGTSTYVIDKIVGGVKHMCAARHQATSGGGNKEQIVCWGDNSVAQIGQGYPGTISPGNLTPVGYYGLATPVMLNSTITSTQFDLASGDNHTCVLDKSGNNTISCWGLNTSNQANPTTTQQSANDGIPVTTVSLASLPSGSAQGISLGNNLSCIVYKQSGMNASTAWCWGAAPRGTTTKGPITKVDNIQEVTQISIGSDHACAIARSAGAGLDEKPGVWCWGANNNHQTNPGDLVTPSIASPVRITFPAEPAN